MFSTVIFPYSLYHALVNVEPCLCTRKNLNNHAKWWLSDYTSKKKKLASRIGEFLVSIDPGDARAVLFVTYLGL